MRRRHAAEKWRELARDDARREHPCLVAYQELPESERAYYRNTVVATLKIVLALGYRLTRER